MLAILSPLFLVWLTALGLVIGSFLNVVIARVPYEESIVRPRSRCPKCGHVLAWFENIPVFSWVALRGRCRACKQPISPRYVLVELLTAALFLASWQRFGWTLELAVALTFVTVLIPLVFIDAEHWILPHEITLPGIALGILIAIPLGVDRVLSAAVGAALGFVLFRAGEFFGWLAFRKEALGGGDKFLLALIAAYLGPKAIPVVLLFASVQGVAYGVFNLIRTGRAGPDEVVEPADAAPPTMTWEFLRPGLPLWKRLVLLPYSVFLQPIPDDPAGADGEEVDWAPTKTMLPFGPWLALGALEVMLLGPVLASLIPLPGLDWLFEGPG